MDFDYAARFKQAQDQTIEMLKDAPAIPLIGIERKDDFEAVIRGAINSAHDGTTPTIEVLLRDEESVDAGLARLSELKKKYGNQINILVGSVIKPEDVEKVAAAGLDGLVSGGFSERVADAALQKGLPYLPGFQTFDEVKMAHEKYGMNVIKLFPAKSPSFKAITAPLARTGMVFLSADDQYDEGLPVCRTATEALAAYERGETTVVIYPAPSDTEYGDIMNYMHDNGMVACCTGGVKMENLIEFAANPVVIAVGASFIVGQADEHESGFIYGLNATITEALNIWSEAQENPSPDASHDMPQSGNGS